MNMCIKCEWSLYNMNIKEREEEKKNSKKLIAFFF